MSLLNPANPQPDGGCEVLLSELAQLLLARGWMMCTAESCTGGLIAATCTELPGSSRWFERGVVTYSNTAKSELLDVPLACIAQHGAVSEPVARAMAEGAARRAGVEVAVSVTGIAGPDGGSALKPVGTVWMAWHVAGRTEAQCQVFAGSRQHVRQQAVVDVLEQLRERLAAQPAPQ